MSENPDKPVFISGVAPHAKWALEQLSVMRRNGATSHEICHEYNRLVYGKDSCPDCEPPAP